MIPWRGVRDEWLILGAAALVAITGVAHGRLHEGDPIVVELGVAPLDATQLACAGADCAFDEHEQPTARQQPLKPFVTLSRELIVMSGVFESPEVKAWLDSAPQKGAKLRCPAVLLERRAQRKVRFQTTDAFAVREVAVLSATGCEVSP